MMWSLAYRDGLDGISIGPSNEGLIKVVGGNLALQVLDMKVP